MKKPVVFLSTLLLCTGILSAQSPVPAPGGVSSPEVWFMTVPVNANALQGSYKWQDFGGDNVQLLKADKTELTALRDSIHTYNFNPALYLSGTDNKEITLRKANLSQTTIIGLWGFKKAKQSPDGFLYNVNREEGEDFLLSKKAVVHSAESGREALNYSPNFTGQGEEKRISILTYCGGIRPNYSIWGRAKKSTINIGGIFSQANGANGSTFDPEKFKGDNSAGYCPEFIVYNRVLTTQERLRVESYLAIKYGITLDDSYLNSAGDTIWNLKDNPDYNNRITGYMRDDASGLNQRTSTTAYEEGQLDIDDTYHNGNSYNKSSKYNLLVMGWQDNIEADNEHYVLFGDNGKPTSIREEDMNKDTSEYKQMERIWMLQTNATSLGNRVELSGDLTADSIFSKYANESVHNVYLVIDRSGSGSFAPGDTEYKQMDEFNTERSKIIFNDVSWSFTNAFTFAFKGDSITLPVDTIPADTIPVVLTNYPYPIQHPSSCGLSNGKISVVNGVRYKLIYPGANTAVENTCNQQDCDISNLPAGTYTLITTPTNGTANNFNFRGAGAWAVSNGTFNNHQTYCYMEWKVNDLLSDTRVAMMLATHYSPPVFNYGVHIVGDKLYTIIEGKESTTFTIITTSDPIRIQRNGNTITFMVNGVTVGTKIVNNGDQNNNAFVAVQSTSGSGISNLTVSSFNFYNQSQGELWFTSPSMIATTGNSQVYTIVLDDNCSGTGPASSGSLTLSPTGSNKFNAHLTLSQPESGTIYIYNPSGLLLTSRPFSASPTTIVETFTVSSAGIYFVNVITDSGKKFSGKVQVY